MRRLALAALAAALPLVLAAPAAGADHLMRVNELSLSSNGSAGAQFVELIDALDEPFPTAPYKLVVFDAAGNRVDAQDLGSAFESRDNTQPFLVGSNGAGLPADVELTLTLPAGQGQVCFTRGMLETRIHCVAYGCPAAGLSSEGGTQRGSAPPASQSLQRLGGSLFIGAPTPKAPNAATAAATCSGAPGGGGPGGGPGGGGAGGDTVAPRQSVAARRRQDIDRLAVSVRPDEAVALTASATVNVPGAARTLRFRTVRRSVGAGIRTRLRLKLSRRNLRSAKRALRRGRRLTAKVKLSARDAAGNVSTARRNIRLAD